MLSEWLQYQGKAGFLIEFLKWYFSKYWQVRTRRVFAQTVTYMYAVENASLNLNEKLYYIQQQVIVIFLLTYCMYTPQSKCLAFYYYGT